MMEFSRHKRLVSGLASLGLLASVAVASPALADEFTLTSPDIKEGHMLADDFVFKGFGCEGGNVSPALSWSGAPEGTESFAITAYDPDAPTGSGWWHWMVYNLPADVTSLPRGAGNVDSKDIPPAATQQRNDYGDHAFGGVCPPPGEVHRYIFTVFALGAPELMPGEDASAALVGFMINANILAKDSITAVYAR